MDEPKRIPAAKLRAIAVAADCDERTIFRVFHDPSSGEKNAARARALKALIEAGVLVAEVA
jgi:hypothetical protein